MLMNGLQRFKAPLMLMNGLQRFKTPLMLMNGLQRFKAPLMRAAWGVPWNIVNHLSMSASHKCGSYKSCIIGLVITGHWRTGCSVSNHPLCSCLRCAMKHLRDAVWLSWELYRRVSYHLTTRFGIISTQYLLICIKEWMTCLPFCM